jgi:hypothetical protein
MELAFAIVFVLTIAALVGGAGLMLGRWLAPRFEQVANEQATGEQRDAVPEDE